MKRVISARSRSAARRLPQRRLLVGAGHRAAILAVRGRPWTARRVPRPGSARLSERGHRRAAARARGAQRPREELERELDDGRSQAHFERRAELTERAARRLRHRARLRAPRMSRSRPARARGSRRRSAACSSSAGDEILTSDEEHPGLLGALAAARDLHGVAIREVPLPRIAEAVGPRTRLVACSHVGWMSGLLAPAELAEVERARPARRRPGRRRDRGRRATRSAATPTPAPDRSGCAAPTARACSTSAPRCASASTVPRRGYAQPRRSRTPAWTRALHEDARRFDSAVAERRDASPARWRAVARARVAPAGRRCTSARARSPARLAELLAERGREPAPRGDTTLVSFSSPDPAAERERLAEHGVILRNIPWRPWLRASVGAWNDEDDLDRLLRALVVMNRLSARGARPRTSDTALEHRPAR